MPDVDSFIARWQGVTASELSTSQSFLIDLCRLLGVDIPHPTPEQDYMFERPITFAHGDGSTSAGRIDLYRRGAFVLESKKVRLGVHTKGFDDALLRARSQAEAYARALPATEGRPPFVVVVDVGHRIELYSEFSRSGGTYVPFPDPRSHRIALDDLRRPEIRERLKRVWTDPLSLDPSRESARVTRDIATRLAELARSLEAAGHPPERVAQFLMRCLFTMFAEDVRLLPEHRFRDLLAEHAQAPDVAMNMVRLLWRDMDTGTPFSAVVRQRVLQFNGGLFRDPDILPLDAAQLTLLTRAAQADWQHVEPAIFGTLLERALSPKDRHKLGAHYTPRAYVERLVLPTVIEPLRREWTDAQAAAGTLAAEDKPDAAIAELQRFHHRLCTVRVLDPACGSGNFLYVTLEHLKRLEGEVLNALDELGYRQTGLALDGERADATAGETVDPHNLLGIEINPRAAAIAEVVLWIGYLQWHYRTRGDVHPPQPVIRDFRNIQNRDAVLAYDRMEFETDERGVPVTRWDGETMKVSPVTGEQVPDETARKPVERYVNPRKAAWPEADFVVGNPPFIGSKRMRELLGDGYVDALQEAWPEVPQATDFVMRWWHHAASLARIGAIQRFGLITTNSLRQAYVRRAVEPHLEADPPLSLVAAIPDHPWVDTADGAAVRIAMTVGEGGCLPGRIKTVVREREEAIDGSDDLVLALEIRSGRINADLTVGVDLTQAVPLSANANLCSVGMKTIGSAFQIDYEFAVSLGLGSVQGLEQHIRPYINGRDLSQKPRNIYVVDFYGLEEDQVRRKYPAAYQHLLERAKPGRDQNRNAIFRDRWWVIGHPRQQFRKATDALSRYIATLETSKHRFFSFLPIEMTPDSSLVTVADQRGEVIGILSSAVHVVWALAMGGRLGVGNDPRYNKSRCFETFPFPDLEAADRLSGPISAAIVRADGAVGETQAIGDYPSDRIRSLAEQLDAHRRGQQAAHPDLTLTGMYNVLEKLRSGETLSAKERTIHEQGLVSILRQLHDELDAAVLKAYGWGDLVEPLRIAHGNIAPVDGGSREDARRTFDEVVLERLVALNTERAAEEARGHVRWLRPEFQCPHTEREPEQAGFDTAVEGEGVEAAAPVIIQAKPQPWPKDTVDQVRAVADVLSVAHVPLSLDEITVCFTGRGPWKRRLPKLLEMLVILGRAQETDGQFTAL